MKYNAKYYVIGTQAFITNEGRQASGIYAHSNRRSANRDARKEALNGNGAVAYVCTADEDGELYAIRMVWTEGRKVIVSDEINGAPTGNIRDYIL